MSLIWNRTHAWDDSEWRSVAACRDTEPELFFPVGTTGMATDQIESAKRVCDHCDAQKACLEFALATNQESGVWGGTTEDERRKLRKQWLAARRPRQRQLEPSAQRYRYPNKGSPTFAEGHRVHFDLAVELSAHEVAHDRQPEARRNVE